MKSCIFGAIALALSTPAAWATGVYSPESVAATFYAVYVKLPPAGIPDTGTRNRLRPLVTVRLAALLRQGADAERRYGKATKGESPPLIEGDLFSSLFEGANSFAVGACMTSGEESECAVTLAYGTTGAPDAKWMDYIYLVRERGQWKVDDITYGGMWEFANHGHVSDALENAIAESRKPVN